MPGPPPKHSASPYRQGRRAWRKETPSEHPDPRQLPCGHRRLQGPPRRRLRRADEQAGEAFSIANDEAGTAALAFRLAAGERPALVILASCGGFERPVTGSLTAEEGLAVAIVNPLQARDFARVTSRLAKTDALDAEVLACFAEAVRPEPKNLPDGEALLLGEILDRRRQIVGMLVARGLRDLTM